MFAARHLTVQENSEDQGREDSSVPFTRKVSLDSQDSSRKSPSRRRREVSVEVEEPESLSHGRGADFLLVFPAVGGVPLPDGADLLPASGPDPNTPEAHSAEWCLKQILFDDIVFTLDRTAHVTTPTHHAEHGHDSANPNEIMECILQQAEIEREQVRKRTHEFKAAKSGSVEYDDDTEGPNILEAFWAAKDAKTRGELRRCALDLMLRYLLCRHCCFEARAFLSVDRDELFVCISARDAVLRAHADMLDYKLQMDPEVACDLMDRRFAQHEVSPPFIAFDVDEEEHFKESKGCSPFRTHRQGRFRTAPSIFDTSDRIRIITLVIEKVFNLGSMVELGLLVTAYPLHDQGSLRPFASSWAMYDVLHENGPRRAAQTMFGKQPPQTSSAKPYVDVDIICTYFGAKLGFRVCFLRFLSLFITPLAFVAVALPLFLRPGLVQLILGLSLMFWAAFAQECWKRIEVRRQLLWGVEDFDETDPVRPQFWGHLTLCPADRKTIVTSYPWYKQMFRRTVSTIATVAFNAFVIITTMALYSYHDVLMVAGKPRRALAINCAVAGLAQVHNFFWDWAAVKLTNFDNCETKNQYKDCFVLRVFSVRFTTSFCSLFYIAFVKFFNGGCSQEKVDCRGELAKQLRISFIFDIVFHCISMAMPFVSYRFEVWRERRALLRHTSPRSSKVGGDSYDPVPSRVQDDDGELCYPEIQAKMPEYTLSEEVSDRLDVWIELGFVLFFGQAAPEVILLFLASNILRLHALGWKLTYAMRRPLPAQAGGIGQVFHFVFSVMTRVAVGCNILLVLIDEDAQALFNSDGFRRVVSALDMSGLADGHSWSTDQDGEPEKPNWTSLLAIFFVLDRGLAVVQHAIDICIPDIPAEVHLQRRRRKAVQKELELVAISHLKVWEGKELQRACAQSPKGSNRIAVLAGGAKTPHKWSFAAPKAVASGRAIANRWTAQDPLFEKVWLPEGLSTPRRSPREDARARLVYAI